MGSLDPESDCKPEFDDSGCVQDDAAPMYSQSYDSIKPDLLDLSDDVLLYILQYCSPMDLKALAFTCPRLFALTLDRTLWLRVDARGQPAGPARLGWYLDHALTPATTELLLTGFAKQADGCLGTVSQKRKDATNERDRLARERQEQLQDIITADLRNNIITVTPSTSVNVHIRIGNPGLNMNQEGGDVAQENGDIAQGNGDKQKNGDKDQKNGDKDQKNGDIVEKNDDKDQKKGDKDHKNGDKVEKDGDKVEKNGDKDQKKGDQDHKNGDKDLKNGDKVEKDGDKVEKNGDKDQKKGDQDHKNGDKDLKNGDKDHKNGDIAQENGDKAHNISGDTKMDTAESDSPKNGHVQDAKTPADNKMDKADSESARDQALDGPKSNETSANSNAEKTSAASNNVQGDDKVQKGNNQDAMYAEAGPSRASVGNRDRNIEPPAPSNHNRRRLVSQQRGVFAPWLESIQRSASTSAQDSDTPVDYQCPGPLFTFTFKMMKQLRLLCPNLSSLALDYCNLNCQKTRLGHFPRTLKKLSIRGIKCYNLPIDKCFLFKIQDYMPILEYLDVSECDWLEPASILGLSKVPMLKHLLLRDCCRLTEFVAYASLASRYGFKTLEVFDLRGSPLGDSEVSAFSWIHSLRELYVAAARARAWPPEHTHFQDDPVPPHQELDDWEMDTDFNFEPPTDPQKDDDSDDDLEALMDQPVQDDMDPQWQNVRWPGHGMPESRYVIISPRPGRGGNRDEPEPWNAGNANEEDKEIGADMRARSPVVEFSPVPQYLRQQYIQEPDYSGARDKETEKRKENGSGDAGDDQAGPSMKKRKDDPKSCSPKTSDDASISSKYTKRSLDDSDSSDDDNDIPSKRTRHNSVNEGASTSKAASESTETTKDSSTQTRRKPQGESNDCECEPNEQGTIRFRRNANPEFVRAPNDNEPLHKVLYVNVSRKLHTVYRLSMPVCTVINSDELRSTDVIRRGRNISAITPLFNTGTMHLDNSSLVTDISVRAFGESDMDDINYIQIGPNGPAHYNRRPQRSNLRVLSITGFRNITDRSLSHLITAAPNLTVLDFSRTNVTERGVENFRGFRVECEVIYSRFSENTNE